MKHCIEKFVCYNKVFYIARLIEYFDQLGLYWFLISRCKWKHIRNRFEKYRFRIILLLINREYQGFFKS